MDVDADAFLDQLVELEVVESISPEQSGDAQKNGVMSEDPNNE